MEFPGYGADETSEDLFVPYPGLKAVYQFRGSPGIYENMLLFFNHFLVIKPCGKNLLTICYWLYAELITHIIQCHRILISKTARIYKKQ